MSGKLDVWMPLYIGDYLKDTSRLTTLGHGAYLLLLMDYWTSGAPLPDDDDQLSAITRLPVRDWKKLRPALARFFVVANGLWTQKRADEEIAKKGEISADRSEAGKAGAAKRWGKGKGKRIASAISEPIAKPSQTDSQSQSQVEEIIVGGDEPILDGPTGVIQVFDRASRKIFGVEKSRAWPASTDHVYAQRFLDAGADIELLEGVFSSLLLRFNAEGQSAPDQLKVFEKWVNAALKAKNSPQAEAKYVNGITKPTRETILRGQLAELDQLRTGGPGPMESFGDPAGGIIIEHAGRGH